MNVFKFLLSFFRKKERTPDVRLVTEGLLLCYSNDYPNLVFDIVDVSKKGVKIRPIQETDQNSLLKFESDLYEGRIKSITFVVYFKDFQRLSIEDYKIDFELKAVKTGPEFIFVVTKRSRSKFLDLYEKVKKVVSQVQFLKENQNYSFDRKLKENESAIPTFSSISTLIALASLQEKKEVIKERKLKLNLYLFFLVFFVFSGIGLDLLNYAFKEYNLRKFVKSYETKTNSKLLFLIHKKRMVGFFGIPIYEYLEVYDAHRLVRELSYVPEDKNVVLVIHSPGGQLLAGFQIVRLLSERKGKKIVVVPYYAMSAGTLIALAADEIYTTESATFGPIDPQIPFKEGGKDFVSAISVLEASDLGLKDYKFSILQVEAKKLLKQTEEFLREVVLKNKSQSVKERIIRELLYTKRTHDYPFFASDFEKLGLNVKKEIDGELKKIVDLMIDDSQ